MAVRVRMPSAASIVARSYPDKIIGIDNQLPWHLKTDLQLFKSRTQDHAVIMGRKTFESIGRPLPNRVNIILSRSRPDFFDVYPSLHWASDPETALYVADVYSIINNKKEFFIIGGEQIYKLFNKFMNRVFVTDVFCGNINGDAKFDVEFDGRAGKRSEWIVKREDEFSKSDVDQYPFRITEYRRRLPLHRYRVKEEAMGRIPNDGDFWLSREMQVKPVEVNDAQLEFWDDLEASSR